MTARADAEREATRALDTALDGSGDAYHIVKAASRQELETVVQMLLHAHRPMRVGRKVECFRDGQPWPCGEFGEIARELAPTVLAAREAVEGSDT